MSLEVQALAEQVEKLLSEMVKQQERKVLEIARSRLPHLTGDDILNSHDFPELMSDPIFNYEEGIGVGLLSSQAALRALFKRLK